MSGLEPLAIFGLACNVMQVISFSHETISTYKRIYDNGSPDDSLAETAAQMRGASTALLDSLNKHPRPLTEDEAELVKLAKSCFDASLKLSNEVDKTSDTKLKKKGNVLRAVKLTVKRSWKKPKIEGLEKDLNGFQRVLETRLLVRLCTQNDALILTQQDTFQSIDQTLRNFVNQCSQGHTRLCELVQAHADSIKAHTSEEHKETRQNASHENGKTRDVVSQEHGQTRDYVSRQLADATASRHIDAERARLMDSLEFQGRNERLHNVTKAYSETFKWLFGDDTPAGLDVVNRFTSQSDSRDDYVDDSSDDYNGAYSDSIQYDSNHDSANNSHQDSSNEFQNGLGNHSITSQTEDDWVLKTLIAQAKQVTWDSFSNWLTSDDHLYWVSGKAGSGKSTLMKCLYSNPQTKQLLDSRGKGDSFLVWHFFYLMGTPMQHNIKGLLCSLLYQFLEQDEDGALISNLFDSFPAVRNKKSDTDWSVHELHDVLFETLRRVSTTRPVCIFLDGLDEIDVEDGAHRLLDLVKELQSYSSQTIKLCVSSREEQAFKNVLGSEPRLQLHSLTAPDMYRYALKLLNSPTSQLSTDIPSHKIWSSILQREFSPTANQLLAITMVEKSEGVFLWTHLALSSLERAFTNGDTWDIIQKRLEEMPNKLKLLYNSMWARLNNDTKAYKSKAALYFNLVIEWPDYRTRFSATLESMETFTIFTLGHLSLAQEIIQILTSGGNILDDFTPSLEKTCGSVYHKIPIRCAGLLEFSRGGYETMPKSAKAARHPDIEVRFIHRTAREFLVETIEGQGILSSDISSRQERLCSLLHAWICRGIIHSSTELSAGKLILNQVRINVWNVVSALQEAQRTLSKATWLDWLKIWELVLYEMHEGCLYSQDGNDLLSVAAQSRLKDFVVLSFRRSVLYTSDYKSQILRYAANSMPRTIDQYLDWFDTLDFLLSQECKPQDGHVFGEELLKTSPLELFAWGLSAFISSELLLSNKELCDRVLQTLQYLIECGADITMTFYCFFFEGGIRDEHGDSFLQRNKEVMSHSSQKRLLLTWTIQDVLYSLAQAAASTYLGRRLAEFTFCQDGKRCLQPLKVIALGEGLYTNWPRTAKKVDSIVGEQILDIISNPIPWAAEDYDHRVKIMGEKIDTMIGEVLYDGEGPENLTNYLLSEFILKEVRPYALSSWLYNWEL